MTNYQQSLTSRVAQLSIPFVSAQAQGALEKTDCKIYYTTCLLLLLQTVDDRTGKAIAYLNQDKHHFHMFHHQGGSIHRCTRELQICSTDLLHHFLDFNEIRT